MLSNSQFHLAKGKIKHSAGELFTIVWNKRGKGNARKSEFKIPDLKEEYD